MSSRLQFALETAYEAGKSTLALFDTNHSVEIKKDNTPVTEADKHAEHLIRKAIKAKYPAEGILGEEEGESGSKSDRWVVDPIDGTKSFISGVPLYATLLSYEQEGIPIIGICYFPALDKMFYAEKGQGAFENGHRLAVSAKDRLASAVLCCGGHASMEKYGRTAGITELAKRTLATRTWSDAYGHALVASGRVEAMIDPVVNRWDVSAMQLVVEEAGGTFTTFDGQTNPQHEAVSSNGKLHQQILDSFKR
ncbi:MAG TPA: inositol monophosphatase family protein [Fimbriimonadaceae bacterium]|jgi:histidinol phosphatase-like enzyme (inositol monophosphatase family)